MAVDIEQEVETAETIKEEKGEAHKDSEATELKWWVEVKQIFNKKDTAPSTAHSEPEPSITNTADSSDHQNVKEVENWWQETMGVMDEVFGKGSGDSTAKGARDGISAEEREERKRKSRSIFQKMIVGGFMEGLKSIKDPLIIHDTADKSEVLDYAIKAVEAKNHIFYPSSITNPNLLGGHGQTLLTEIKDEYINLAFKQFDLTYDAEELLTLKDGGQMLLNYMF